MLRFVRVFGVLACASSVAIGVESGLFTRVFSEAVGKEGHVSADEKVVPPQLVFPIVPKYGGVLPRPKAVEQPRSGAKVVFDATAEAKPADINKGLDRVARLLNLYGVAGLKAQDVKITIVLHGEATKSVLNDTAYKARFQVEQNPNLPLILELQKAGVEVLVCGQALNYKGFQDGEVTDGIPIAAAALTVVVNKQADGYSYIPVP
jgi:intracellular sulfur oxidation DsrE/DsrF family protein